MKSKYLTVHDYGTGGTWCYMYADSPEQITEKYPELEVISDKPDWLTGDILKNIEKNLTFDIDSEPEGFLKALVMERDKHVGAEK